MAVDWWAYGVFLYEMMAGFPPFYDDDPPATYKKILAGRFSFPRTSPSTRATSSASCCRRVRACACACRDAQMGRVLIWQRACSV